MAVVLVDLLVSMMVVMMDLVLVEMMELVLVDLLVSMMVVTMEPVLVDWKVLDKVLKSVMR